ncbi:MAG: HRDC domain-containing protein [Rickettsiales bacterium]|nr:HRDC domain-containing protein [Rickettsiales bacterium]
MFYIDNTEDLVNICEEIKKNANIIGVDTEFTKQIEYFPTLSIIQISFFNGEVMKNCIVDVLAKGIDLSALKEIFDSKKIKKVFHSCSQDLEGLYNLFHKIPCGVEDTQIMAEFCSMKSNLSYTDLIKETLAIIVRKDRELQISDWKIRPLSEEQLNYASNDVDYLLELYIKLLQKLDLSKNFKFYRAEIEDRYGQDMIENIIQESSWRRTRFRIGNKTNLYMNLLKQVCRLRESFAIKNNVIKNVIMPDSILKPVLVNQPKNVEDFDKLYEKNDRNIKKSFKKAFVKECIKIFEKVQIDKIEEKPYIIELKDKAMLQKFEEINDYIISECKRMDINPEIVQNKIDLSSYISNSENLEDLFSEWKIKLFGKRIKEIKER